MKRKSSLIVIGALLAFSLGAFSLTTLAQHEGQAGSHEAKIHVGKTGDFSFSSEMKVGDVSLPAGAYKFKHIVEGEDHVVVFTKATSGKEVARVKCKIEPLGDKAKQTTIYSTPDASGKSSITQILVAGENVKHVF